MRGALAPPPATLKRCRVLPPPPPPLTLAQETLQEYLQVRRRRGGRGRGGGTGRPLLQFAPAPPPPIHPLTHTQLAPPDSEDAAKVRKLLESLTD